MITLKKLKGLRPPPPPLKQPHGMHACTELLPTTPAHTHIFLFCCLFISVPSIQTKCSSNNSYRFWTANVDEHLMNVWFLSFFFFFVFFVTVILVVVIVVAVVAAVVVAIVVAVVVVDWFDLHRENFRQKKTQDNNNSNNNYVKCLLHLLNSLTLLSFNNRT